MADYRFERQCRTPQSEAYEIHEAQDRVGRIDLHFTDSVVYGTLLVERELNEEEIQDLIEVIDDELVDTADTPRTDFLVTVFQGRELGVYSDDVFEEETEGENHH